MKMMSQNQTESLATIAAKVDALHYPFRISSGADGSAWSAISERRGQYGARGVPVTVAGDGGERLAGERELLALQQAGMIQLHYGGKRIGASTTPLGEATIRRIVARTTAHDDWPLVRLIEKARVRAGKTNGGFTLEDDVITVLTGKYRDQIPHELAAARIAEVALSLLSGGFVESASDTVGHLGYRATPRGLAANRRQLPNLPQNAYSRAVAEIYDQVFEGELAARPWWRPSNSLVAIPLGAGSWPKWPDDAPPSRRAVNA